MKIYKITGQYFLEINYKDSNLLKNVIISPKKIIIYLNSKAEIFSVVIVFKERIVFNLCHLQYSKDPFIEDLKSIKNQILIGNYSKKVKKIKNFLSVFSEEYSCDFEILEKLNQS